MFLELPDHKTLLIYIVHVFRSNTVLLDFLTDSIEPSLIANPRIRLSACKVDAVEISSIEYTPVTVYEAGNPILSRGASAKFGGDVANNRRCRWQRSFAESSNKLY